MAVPKRKMSKSRKRHRMAHWKQIGELNLIICPNPQCRRLHRPHRACPHCGLLKGRQVIRKRRRLSQD